jgi:Tol biopolymer transport system component
MNRLGLAAAMTLGATAFALAPAPSYATFAGNNGKIVFTSNRNAQNDIYVMNANSSQQTRLTTDLANDRFPRWSPSGARIAFASNRNGNFEIYTMNADGTHQTRLTNDPLPDNYPSWTADGNQIVFQRGGFSSGEIYIMGTDGSGQINLTNDPAADFTPATSPRDSKIVFGSDRGGSGGLFIIRVDGSGLTRITTTPGTDWLPNWSPTGNDIVFLRDVSGTDDDIYTVHADGSGLRRLTNTPARDEQNPVWSPDGSKILFAGCGAGGDCQLYTIKPDGSGEQQLTSGSFGPPPPTPYQETFDDNTINPAFWTVFGATSDGISATLVDQQLEMTLGSGSVNSTLFPAFGVQAASRCLLQGDFDMQVDYRLLEWPASNGAHVALAAEEPISFVGRAERLNNGDGGIDAYGALLPSSSNQIPTSDLTGTLRLVRSGATATAYFLSGGSWVPILSGPSPTDETLVTLTAFSDEASFGHQEVKIAFDNFKLNSGSLDPTTCGELRNNFPDWQALPRSG